GRQRLRVLDLRLVSSAVDVRLTGAMTGLAALLARRCAGVRRARMRAAFVALVLILVARETGLLTDVTGRRSRRGGLGDLGRFRRRRAVLARGGGSGHRDRDHHDDPEPDRGDDGGLWAEGAREATHRSS